MVNCGVPVTATTSLKVIVIPAVLPNINIPSLSGDETLSTVGTIPSTIMALFALKDVGLPGIGRVRLALFPEGSIIVPLLSANAESLA